MPLHKRFWFVLILSLTVILAACGGDDDSGDSNNSSDNGDSITLAQSVTSDDGISINYPDGWAVDTSFGIFIANSQDLFDGDTSNFEDNQVLGSIISLPATGAEGEDASSLLDGYVQSTLSNLNDGENLNFEDVETFDANGKSAAIVTGSGTSEGVTNDLANIVVAVDDENYVLFSFLSGDGQMAQFLDTLRAIAGSVEFASPTDGNADG